jgi:hypothetical protein
MVLWVAQALRALDRMTPNATTTQAQLAKAKPTGREAAATSCLWFRVAYRLSRACVVGEEAFVSRSGVSSWRRGYHGWLYNVTGQTRWQRWHQKTVLEAVADVAMQCAQGKGDVTREGGRSSGGPRGVWVEMATKEAERARTEEAATSARGAGQLAEVGGGKTASRGRGVSGNVQDCPGAKRREAEAEMRLSVSVRLVRARAVQLAGIGKDRKNTHTRML